LRAATPGAAWIVCGDHGESLGDHGERTHGLFVYDATARVPLIVAAPGRVVPSRRDDARLVDVMPTILAIAGVSAPPGLDGRSLLEAYRGDAPHAYVETMYANLDFGAAPVRAASDGRIKAIDVPKREAYDLTSDPAESRNVAGTPAAGALFAELRSRPAAAPPPNLTEPPNSNEALRSLGYVGAGASYRLETAGMDPKDFVPLYRTLDDAHALALARRWPEAASRYASLLTSFPRSSLLEQEYGMVLLASGKLPEAEPHLLRAVSLDPANVHAWLGLANIAIARSDGATAEKRLLALLAVDPDDVEGNFDLGLLYYQTLGRPTAAPPYWERFLKLQPTDPEAPKIREMLKSVQR
jgi:Flp pilus assembly protein TadD